MTVGELQKMLDATDTMEEANEIIREALQKDLDGLLDYYKTILEELDQLLATKDILRLALIQHFKENNLRNYAGKGMKAWVNTRTSHFISVSEAEKLLPPDLFGKLVHETVSVIFTVRRAKDGNVR